LESISKKFDEDVYLILDNHPSHLSNDVKEILVKNKRIKLDLL
jgi:hypothetical protein